MKIWITYFSASSLVGNGLENVCVWFAKPSFTYVVRGLNEDHPFTNADTSHGLVRRGWLREYSEGEPFERKSVSFGKVFGYADSEDKDINAIATFVWGKLVEHFGDSDLLHWMKIEEEGRALPENFLLELNLTVKLQ